VDGPEAGLTGSEDHMKTLGGVVSAFGVAVIVLWHPGTMAQGTPELIIRKASIVNADGRSEGDIRIRGEKIAEIGRNLTAGSGAREIDASGLVVLPGGVDPHVHPGQNFTSESAAALAGGATTISTMITAGSPGGGGGRGATAAAGGTPPVNPLANEDLAGAIHRTDEKIKKEAMADFILHVMVNDPEKRIDQLEGLLKTGQTSIKIFMNRPSFVEHERAYMALIRKAGEVGVLPLIHCEDDSLINDIGQRFIDQGKGDIRNVPLARPVLTEEVATQRCVAFSEATGAPVYIVHISSERALRAAEVGRAKGLPIHTEVRWIYLFLTDDIYKRDDFQLYIGQPPYRKQTDVDYLWKGINNHTVDVVDTDHNTFTKAVKMEPQTVLNHRAGMNGLQDYLPVIWDTGVRSKKITAETFVAITSTNPAKLMGIYPQKGRIAVGSDADIVLWDPNETRTIRDQDELSAAKHSFIAGRSVTGWPRITIRRGEVVWENRQIKSQAGSGRLIPRHKLEKAWTGSGAKSTSAIKE
jgi:dihydropyrimidinase